MLGCKSPSSLAFMKLSVSQAAHTLVGLNVTQKSEREDYYNLYFINEKRVRFRDYTGQVQSGYYFGFVV